MIVAGIDEAGYGPKLGPMVVASAHFETAAKSSEQAAQNVRLLLSKLPVAVADSKKLYSPKTGLCKLELSALALLGASGVTPATVGELLASISPYHADDLKSIPWYSAAWDIPLPADCPSADVQNATHAVADKMRAAGVSSRVPHAVVLSERALNAMWRHEPNKERASFAAFRRLLAKLADAGDAVHLTVDQQGGRRNYLPWLCECFPGEMPIEKKAADRRIYHLVRHALRILITPRADAEFPEVSAASIFAKYLRELLMKGFFRYWRDKQVKPTDGYSGSWRSFMNDVQPLMRELRLLPEDILRTH